MLCGRPPRPRRRLRSGARRAHALRCRRAGVCASPNAARLPGGAPSRLTRSAVAAQAIPLLEAARGAFDAIASTDEETVAFAELFGGAAMRGLPHVAAPRKSVAADAVWVAGATTRDCRKLDDGYVAARAAQLYALAAVSDALRSTVGLCAFPPVRLPAHTCAPSRR